MFDREKKISYFSVEFKIFGRNFPIMHDRKKLLIEMVQQGIKECSCCKEIKQINEFNKCKGSANGYNSQCKLCCKNSWSKYAEKNKQELKQKKKQRRFEKLSDSAKENYESEKKYRSELEELQKINKRRCRLCKIVQSINEFHTDKSGKCFYGKKSYCKKCHMEKYAKPYRQTEIAKTKKANHDKKYFSKPCVRERIGERRKFRYKNDVCFKLAITIRNRINKHLSLKNQNKIASAIKDLGCSINDLILHLESQFHKNPETGEEMNWDNHNFYGWHVDHKKPLCAFNLKDPKQFQEACHYSNLQPLWAKENLSKNGKY